MSEILSHTESVCPDCLARIPAARVLREGDVYLEKTCAQHGSFSTIIWRGQVPAFNTWVRPKTPSFPKNPFTEVKLGCPYDCGICPDHQQQSCCVLLEVTQRCDLHCPICFADAAHGSAPDWSMAQIGAWYERLLTAGGPFNIQLSGGEPCVRDDLPEIIRLGRTYGFTFFQLNTNGLRLARDAAYLQELKDAGLSTVFLQFDGTRDEIYRHIRGRALLKQKMAVIQRCEELEIGVVLVPTLIPGVNSDDVGNIIQLALAHMPTVRGVHFQPISYFGRYELNGKAQAPANADRITIPEVIQAIESQTNGLLKAAAFCPPGGENALCSFHANFVQMPDGSLTALTRHKVPTPVVDTIHTPLVDLTLPLMGTAPSLNLDLLIQTLPQEAGGCCGLPANNEKPVEAALGAARSRAFVAENWSAASAHPQTAPASGPSFGEWDVFLERKRTHTFCVSGMAFQDAWTLDLERLRDCYIHTASPDGRLVPFCAYNLTDSQGRSLYRRADESLSA
ncbi:MAG: radical SAM (seleno)protein TrsS [Chloroflexota bacterium]